MTTCSKCFLVKSEDEFNWKVKGVKRSGVCKKCHSEYRKQHYHQNKQKYISKAKKWKALNDSPMLRHHLSQETFDEMLAAYDGMCWCCKKRPAVSIDHDHACCPGDYSCGECVRGLLCMLCNTGLGKLGDTLDSLNQAVLYLQTYESHKC